MKTKIRFFIITSAIVLLSGLVLTSSSAKRVVPGPSIERTSKAPKHVAWFGIANFLSFAELSELGVSKTGPDTGTPDTNITYTIEVSNNGPDSALNAALNDPLPENTTFVSISAPAGWNCTTPLVGSGGTVNCTNPNLAVASAYTFTLVVHVASSTPPGTVIINTATISSSNSDSNTDNNSSFVTTFVQASNADISVTKAGPDTASPGTNLTYTIQVANSGPDNATNAALNDLLPAGTTFVSVSTPAGWNCTTPLVGFNGTVNCTNPSLAVTSGDTFTLIVFVDPMIATNTFITNVATVSTNPSDSNGENNSSSTTSLVQGPSADMGVTKSTSVESQRQNTDVTYTIVVSNAGPDAAANAELNDTLPGNMTFVSLSAPAGWSCTTPSVGASGLVKCSNPSLGVTSGHTFTLVGHIPLGTPDGTVYQNEADVSSSTTEFNLENNNSSALTTVVSCFTDLPVTSNADNGPGSLRQAILDACPDSIIYFDSSLVSPITITSGELVINKNLTIQGPGAGALTIKGNRTSTGFHVLPGNSVAISDLSMTQFEEVGLGGAIRNDGTLTVERCILFDNKAGNGGGIFNDTGASLTVNNSKIGGATLDERNDGIIGGGITSRGTLAINASTIEGNQAAGLQFGPGTATLTDVAIINNTNQGSGGGISNVGGTGTVINSTISGNSSPNSGGGVLSTTALTLTGVTITNNRCDLDNGGGQFGCGISRDNAGSGALILRNSIVAGNFSGTASAPGDINEGTVDSTSSFNLIGTGGSGGLVNGVNQNQVGVANAGLDPLANNGGPTKTHALQCSSPAIDKGKNLATDSSSNPIFTDQRGFQRPVDFAPPFSNAAGGDGSDIGAYELQLNGSCFPAAVAPNPQPSTNEDVPVTITLTGTFYQNAPLSFTITQNPANGVLNTSGLASPNCSNTTPQSCTASVTYTPGLHFNGTDSFKFKVSAGGGFDSNPTDVFITVNPVNDAPVANPQSVATTEEVPLGITLTGSDTENSPLTFTVLTNPANGVLSGTAPNLTYTPNPNFFGADSFTFKVSDGSLDSSPATISINVNGVNDGPVNTVPGAQSTPENFALVFSQSQGNRISIVDNDAGSNPVHVTLTASNGSITLNGTAGLTFTPAGTGNDGSNDAQLTFTGTVTSINNALNGLTFTPTAGYTGPASLQIVSNDQGNTGSGGALSDSDTVQITVLEGGTLAFSSATYGVAEEAGTATITVNRTGGNAGTTTINYATLDGTAVNGPGLDYTTSSGTLTFADGVTSQTFTIPINNDLLNEAPETINLTLSTVTGSGTAGAPLAAVLTITDNDPQPSISINDVAQLEGNSGTTSFTFTVSLSAPSGQTVTVNYQTANGSATAPSDYTAIPSTLLTFSPGETTKSITVLVNGDTLAELDDFFFVNLSNPTNATISDGEGIGTILSDDAPVVQFSSSVYTVGEGGGHVVITVNRLGNLSIASRVDYASSDLSGLNECAQITSNASQRCDYTTVVGTLRFAAGEASKEIIIPIIDDVHVDWDEVFTLTLSNAVGVAVGPTNPATITIIDNDTGPAPNPIFNDAFFIRELYIDLLGRLPEPGAVNTWLGILNNCAVPSDPVNGCDRIAVAAGFLRSEEFQGRGFFVYRHYSAVLGRIPLYSEYIPDMAKVNGFLSNTDLEANKLAYTDEVMNRPEFHALYDSTLNNPTAYVDKLLQTANLPNHPSRAGWIAALTNNTLTRAQVLRQFIDSAEVYTKYVNEAFIIMNYFGFLRRSADASYQAWFDIFNNTNDYRLIINGFMNSAEYRLRFGP